MVVEHQKRVAHQHKLRRTPPSLEIRAYLELEDLHSWWEDLKAGGCGSMY